jgi:hypothetical protein
MRRAVAASALSIEPCRLPTPVLSAVSRWAAAARDSPADEPVAIEATVSPVSVVSLAVPGLGLQAMKNHPETSRKRRGAIRLSMVRSESPEMPRAVRSQMSSFDD